MSAKNIVMAAAGVSTTPTYVDDVFSTYLYNGNGGTQTITNGIDLAGKGGLVWIKCRDGAATNNMLFDTARGVQKRLQSNTTAAEASSASYLTAFNSTGFGIGSDGDINSAVAGFKTLASWTFRKAPKFFDVVTWSGNNSGGRQIPHSLATQPYFIIVKETNQTGNWTVQTQALSDWTNKVLFLNLTTAAGGGTERIMGVSDSTITLGALYNYTGTNYVAYLFAHDTAADGMIRCGSFTTDGSGNATVTLGWEPQFVLIKRTDSLGNWFINDSMRNMVAAPNLGNMLFPNLSSVESANNGVAQPTSTGFTTNNGALNLSATYIYMAIRRPNKPPTTGTQVYSAIARTGTGAAATVTGVGFAPDYLFESGRSGQTSFVYDRLRGAAKQLSTTGTQSEATLTPIDTLTAWGMDGYTIGADASGYINSNGVSYINHFFRRAPGFFDVVCYTGSLPSLTVSHNLGVVPELIIVKGRSAVFQASGYYWMVYNQTIGTSQYLFLNADSAAGTASVFGTPTATTFVVANQGSVNYTGEPLVAYLFATKAGISKVGSYIGNGGTQTINCGFSAGARFILIKRTDSTGNWYVWDTARGVVAGNDPHLSLNSTAAEVTTNDSIDPDSTGFIVNQVAATNVNVTSATYIFLAIA